MPYPHKRSVPGVGAIWDDRKIVKMPYLYMPPDVIAENWEALLVDTDNQNKIFGVVETKRGITLKKIDAVYFPPETIHLGTHNLDPNKQAIHIDVEADGNEVGNNFFDQVILKIYVTLGKGEESQYKRCGTLLTALRGFAFAMHPQALAYGWPADVGTEPAREKYQPIITLKRNQAIRPDDPEGIFNNAVGYVPTLKLIYSVSYRENNFPAS